MPTVARLLLSLAPLLAGFSTSHAFLPSSPHAHSLRAFGSGARVSMVLDVLPLNDLSTHFAQTVPAVQHWVELVIQGIADSAVADSSTNTAAVEAAQSVATTCKSFGQDGWTPFCLDDAVNPFKIFDTFQLFIQNSIVSFHDALESAGVENAYGPSIILFTFLVRLVVFPLTFYQLASTQRTQALNPKLQEIREKYADDKNMQSQMVALLYEETKTNPLSGCLPALVQVPVFIALYRSFFNLASSTNKLMEPFLWLPNLEGPVYGKRSSDWLFSDWHNFTPSLGWEDTLAYLSLPILLVIAQTISLRVTSPPSDDPTIQRTQQILKYLPWLLGYFCLSVPAGLGIYWIANNFLSTLSTFGIKAYFKQNPVQLAEVNVEELFDSQFIATMDPAWGYKTRADVMSDARKDPRIQRVKIPDDFVF